MDPNNLKINFIKLFNRNLILRFLSALLLVPAFIFSLLIGSWVLIFFYIFILTIINLELKSIFILSNNKYLIIGYYLIANFTLLSLPLFILSKESSLSFILYIIFSVWIFDTLSFFGGSFFKGKKIFPKISHGKTYSGMASGFLSLIIANLILYNFLEIQFFYVIVFSLLIGMGSFIGDALVSVIKRSSYLKDTGNILPGHGGILDRMDSFIFVFFNIIIFNLF